MHPILLRIGPWDIPPFWILGPFHVDVTLRTYGTMLAIAFLTAIAVIVARAKREGIAPDQVFDLSVYAVISALIGAKLLLVFADLRYFLAHPAEILSILRAGGVFYGGFLAAGFVTYFYLKKHKLPVWKVADLIAPGIAIGQAIGRLGCFSAGCCFGKPSTLPWAYTFTDMACFELSGTPLDIALHPTQLYESFSAFGLFLALLLIHRRKSFDGQVFWMYAIVYSALRLGLEFFRNDERGMVLGLISTSQFIALLVFPVSLVVYWRLRRASRAPA